MKYEYELTKQDFIDFNLFHLMYAKSTRRSYFIRRYIFSLSFLTLPFILVKFTNIQLGYWLIIFTLYYIYWVVAYPKRIKNMVTNRISRIVDKGKTVSVLGTHLLTISQEEIVDKSLQTEARTKFSDIANIVEDKDHIYVYVNADSAHIIPNSIFFNEVQKQGFLDLLRQRVGQTT